MSFNQVAIKVEGLGKRFEIYGRPSDRLKQFILPRLQRLLGVKPRQYFHEFWALRDISFELKRGETVGIIGRNGSGKSTLLQIICGTLTPTDGSVQTSGRIAALLELGSGFNPEFTGRENVYLNASVLGLSKDETDARFDEIVKFADIGDFIEQPTKTYSSGMMVRLAFAVIAHVDADILVVDEALAVGDAIFTQKCMRFIREFQKHGTLLFVSHDMSSVLNLCESAIWLDRGNIEGYGGSKKISENYLKYTQQEAYGADITLLKNKKNDFEFDAEEDPNRKVEDRLVVDYESKAYISDRLNEANGWRTGLAEITSVNIKKIAGVGEVFNGGERVVLELRATTRVQLKDPILGFMVKDRLGQDLFGENTLPLTAQRRLTIEEDSSFEAKFYFKLPMLPNGEYFLMCSVANGDLNNHTQHHFLHDAAMITVFSSRVRWGLVGLEFSNIEMNSIDNASDK